MLGEVCDKRFDVVCQVVEVDSMVFYSVLSLQLGNQIKKVNINRKRNIQEERVKPATKYRKDKRSR